MTRTKNILLVEDDLNLGLLLLDYLQAEDYKVKLCRDGNAGLKALEQQVFDLCILDVMMPKISGYTLAEIMRKKGNETPFVFLTAKSLKEDRLKGYELGAEDFISKPFDPDELLCKIKAILRRTTTEVLCEEAHLFCFGSFKFDSTRQELLHNKEALRITEKEAEVLKVLCLNKNQIVKREEAVQKIYGRYDYFLGRSFDVYISRLRKLLSADESVQIKNVFKVGFMLDEQMN